MQVPDKDGKPVITNEMKAECIGEFHVEIDIGCNECDGDGCWCCEETGEAIQRVDVPWTMMKDIYKLMASVASRSMTK